MEKLLFLIFYLPLTLYGQTVDLYLARVEKIKQINDQVPAFFNEMSELSHKVKSYNHLQMINKDKEELKQIEQVLTKMQSDIELAQHSLFTSSAEDKIKKLEEKAQERLVFTNNQKKVDEIEKMLLSKRATMYIQLLKEGKDTQASIVRASIGQEERDLIDQYDQARIYVIQQEGVQDYLLKTIDKFKNEIEKDLSYPEAASIDIQNAKETKQILEDKFLAQKEAHSRPQIDIIADQWSSGLFSCEAASTPKLYRYKNFPNLIALTNEGQVKSILKVSNSTPNNREFVYKCKKFGSFGGCLENTEKEVCKSAPACENALAQMEDAFDKNEQFKSLRDDYITHSLAMRQKDFEQGRTLDILQEFEKKGTLGNISTSELDAIFEDVMKEAKSLPEQDPTSFLKDITKNIDVKMKPILLKHKTSDDTIKSLEYLQATMKSFFNNLIETDDLQEFAFTSCQKGQSISAEFCEKYSQWKKHSSLFDEKIEIENLVADECPRIVLRLKDTDHLTKADLAACGLPTIQSELGIIDQLENDANQILMHIK